MPLQGFITKRFATPPTLDGRVRPSSEGRLAAYFGLRLSIPASAADPSRADARATRVDARAPRKDARALRADARPPRADARAPRTDARTPRVGGRAACRDSAGGKAACSDSAGGDAACIDSAGGKSACIDGTHTLDRRGLGGSAGRLGAAYAGLRLFPPRSPKEGGP